MLSSMDLERLIAEKRREIENEKAVLGLTPQSNVEDIDKENKNGSEKGVRLNAVCALRDATPLDSEVPPGLERYIRRCTGLPVMLKAGEYSPNNPLGRGERPSGDVLGGLGEYERRRNTLRKLRQQQYREYLDQQAKIKKEAKEKAERERHEREERERAREEEKERERRKLEEARVQIESPVRRASLNYGHTPIGSNNAYVKKADACVQVGLGGFCRPLSVAVQTDAYIEPSDPPEKLHTQQRRLTPAERELSPRSAPRAPLPLHRQRPSHDGEAETGKAYTPSILDAEAIERRNMRAEQEAAAKREYYQRELKNQILEQQRIREERQARERLLEQAERRRLEQQLRALAPRRQEAQTGGAGAEGRARAGPAPGGVLTQLGAIRRQLQLEQRRLDSLPR